MSSHPPESLDPWRLADKRRVIRGRYPLSELPRLAPLLAECRGDAVFELAFSRDEHRRPVIHGSLDARLSLTCQRCLEIVEMPVSDHFVLTVVAGLDEARDLPDESDSLMLTEPTLSVRDLVEDELLLSLPPVPRHEDCVVETEWRDERESQDGDTEKNPFGVLAVLRGGRRND